LKELKLVVRSLVVLPLYVLVSNSEVVSSKILDRLDLETCAHCVEILLIRKLVHDESIRNLESKPAII